MRFKGLKVVRFGDGMVQVVPLYWTKRGGTRRALELAVIEHMVEDAVESVLAKLRGRGDLRE